MNIIIIMMMFIVLVRYVMTFHHHDVCTLPDVLLQTDRSATAALAA